MLVPSRVAVLALLVALCCLAARSASLAPDGKPKLYIGGHLSSRIGLPYCPGTTQTVSNRLYEVLSRADMLGFQYYYSNYPREISDRVDAFIAAILDYTDTNTVPRTLSGPATKQGYQLSLVAWTPTYAWQPSASPGASFLTSQSTFEIHATCLSGADTNEYSARLALRLTNAPAVLMPPLLNGTFASLMTGVTVDIPLTNRTAGPSGDLYGSVTTTQTFNVPATWTPSGMFVFNIRTLYGVIAMRLLRGTNVVDQVPVPWESDSGIPYSTTFNGSAWNGRPVSQALLYTMPNTWSEVLDPRCNWTGDPRYTQWFSGGDQTFIAQFWPGFAPAPVPLNLASYMLTSPTAIYDSTQSDVYVLRVFDGMGRTKMGVDWFNPLTNQMRSFVANRPFQSVDEMTNLIYDAWLNLRTQDHDDTNTFGLVPAVSLPDGSTKHVFRIHDFFTMVDPCAGTTFMLR
jgi:hypothetical protein